MLAGVIVALLFVWALWFSPVWPATNRLVTPVPSGRACPDAVSPDLDSPDLDRSSSTPASGVVAARSSRPRGGSQPSLPDARLVEDDLIAFGLALEASPDVLADLLADSAGPSRGAVPRRP